MNTKRTESLSYSPVCDEKYSKTSIAILAQPDQTQEQEIPQMHGMSSTQGLNMRPC